MHEIVLTSILDNVLFAIPAIGLLLIAIFRLDNFLVPVRHTHTTRRAESGIGRDGQLLMSDPDGRRWRAPNTYNEQQYPLGLRF